MTDVILVATIIVFFVAAALLVRVLDRMIAGSRDEDGPDEEAAEADASGHQLEPGGSSPGRLETPLQAPRRGAGDTG